MKITICGSMSFFDQMLNARECLESLGHEVLMPEMNDLSKTEHIRDHYEKIKSSDAVLVANYDKGEKRNYIGPSALMEMGFAFVLGKMIFVLNDPSGSVFYEGEVEPMQPIVLNGDLSKI